MKNVFGPMSGKGLSYWKHLIGISLCSALLSIPVHSGTATAATWPNLVTNPSFELASPADPGTPLGWARGKWGVNDASFEYPSEGSDGTPGASVRMTSRTRGDAKWASDPVTVTPGSGYVYEESYKSNTGTELIVEYGKSDGSVSYLFLGSAPASESWTRVQKTFTAPADVRTARVFHILESVGTLSVDAVSISAEQAPPTDPDNLVQNPSVEIVSPANASVPLDWNKGKWGSNSTTFSYPSAALDGSKGLSIRMWSRNSGDAKWHFKHVPVTAGTEYVYSDHYRSDVRTLVTVQYSHSDGTYSYVELGAAAPVADWTKYEKKFTPPAGAVSLSVFHRINAAGYLDTDNVRLSPAKASEPPPPADTEAPTIAITSPKNGAIIGKTTNLTFSGSDNVGIVSVHYSVSNANDVVVGQLTAPPYVASIPTEALKNGSHVITAHAVDAAGNIGNAAPVTYQTFFVAPPPETPNVVANPSFESMTGGMPEYWVKGGYGNNSASYNYPVEGVDGGRAAEVVVHSWTDGDAKWFFEDVPVKAGEIYTFSDQYKSNAPSIVNLRYLNSDGSYTYDGVAKLPATTGWQTYTTSISIPANAERLTVFHLLASTGTLAIDNVRLNLGFYGPRDPNAFETGFVSLTFDDGWSSHYNTAFPLLEAAGHKGSFYVITNEMKEDANPNRVKNASLEASGSGGGAPEFWTSVRTGSNNASFTYPVAGISGGKAMKIDVTDYASGDAAWRPDPTTVVNQEPHNFTDQYFATAPSVVTVEYEMRDGSRRTEDLWTLPARSGWTVASFTFTPPADAGTVTVYHRLVSAGTLVTDDYHLDMAQGYLSTSQIREMYQAGHEISAHSRTHPFLTMLDPVQAAYEISGSRQDLVSAGFVPSDAFVYPYGDYNDAVVQHAKDAGFLGARSVDQGYNTKATNKYGLMIQEVSSGTTAETWKSWADKAMSDHTWLILMFHQIDHQKDEFWATPEDLKEFLDYLNEKGIPTVTMRRGLQMMDE